MRGYGRNQLINVYILDLNTITLDGKSSNCVAYLKEQKVLGNVYISLQPGKRYYLTLENSAIPFFGESSKVIVHFILLYNFLVLQ